MAEPRLALSAVTVPELAPTAVVECAVAAGYRMCGLRLPDPRSQAPGVARAMARCGVALLEVDTVRLGPGRLTDADRRLADTAGALGAAHLRVVVTDPDEPAAVAKLAELRELLSGTGTRIAVAATATGHLTHVADAERIARAVPDATVLTDPMHLDRAGDPPGPAVDPVLTGYARFTDARTVDGVVQRMPPGEGTLRLDAFLAALPAHTPLACAVGSPRMAARYGALARADRVRIATEWVLGRTTTPLSGSGGAAAPGDARETCASDPGPPRARG